MLTGRTDHPVTDAEAAVRCRTLDQSYASGNELTKTKADLRYLMHGHRVSCEESVYRETSCDRLLGKRLALS